jgi:hypothetical protein
MLLEWLLRLAGGAHHKQLQTGMLACDKMAAAMHWCEH